MATETRFVGYFWFVFDRSKSTIVVIGLINTMLISLYRAHALDQWSLVFFVFAWNWKLKVGVSEYHVTETFYKPVILL